MRWHLACILLLSAAVLAGCAGTTPSGSKSAAGTFSGLVAGAPLWDDPQDTPHPKWHWATLSNPPNGTMPPWWTPVNATPLPGHITGFQHLGQAMDNQSKPLGGGAGIAIFGHVAVVPEDSQYAHFVDISDPAHPREVGRIDSTGRGAAIIAYPDGRLVTAISTTPGFDVIEFTDPTHPEMLAQVKVPVHGGHKLGIVPGTPILYNAGSQGGDPGVPGVVKHPLYGPGLCNVDISQCVGYTEIYNLTDPANPVLVENFMNGLSCHHIFFWDAPDGSKQRAICAGIQYTQLWDTTDPQHPSVIVSLPVHSGMPGTPSAMASIEAFSHSAGINIKGDILYVGDESGGGGVPPGCVQSVDTPDGAVAVPVGATWFYDISNEKSPRLLGYYSPSIGAGTYVGGVPVVAPDGGTVHSLSCTTHHGRLVPDKEGRDLLAMSYYGDGVVLLDFTGIDVANGKLPKVVGSWAQGSNTWETWYDQGYLFTGDGSRGLDSFTLT